MFKRKKRRPWQAKVMNKPVNLNSKQYNINNIKLCVNTITNGWPCGSPVNLASKEIKGFML
jgi:hypothetical protein